jgi:hypothetical protein
MFRTRRPTQTQPLLVTFVFFAAACSGKDPDLGKPVTENPCDIPVDNLSAMKAWVEEEQYLDWPSEPAPHDSAGPHFGNVRTWISPELEESLLGGEDLHPLCSATVKELYGSGTSRRGWAASVKVSDTGTSSNWYWFEVYDGETLAAGTDIDLCTGCHSSGPDFVRTTVPLSGP